MSKNLIGPDTPTIKLIKRRMELGLTPKDQKLFLNNFIASGSRDESVFLGQLRTATKERINAVEESLVNIAEETNVVINGQGRNEKDLLLRKKLELAQAFEALRRVASDYITMVEESF